MADFLSGIFDRAGDLVDGITGKSANKAYQAQLDAQRAANQSIIDLQNKELAFEQTPEYLASKQKRMYVGFGVLIICILAAVYLITRK